MPGAAQTARPMARMEWAILIALSIIWGGAYLFNAVAVAGIPVFTVVACRVALGASILLVILRMTGQRMPSDRKAWSAFFALGLLNNAIPFTLIVWGQQHIASGVASILNATAPLFTVVLAHWLTTDEKMTGRLLAGVLTGFAGVAIMIGLDSMQSLGANVTAQIACLGGALAYALGGIYARRFRAMGIAPMATATGQVIASSAILLPFALMVDQPWTLPPPGTAAVGAVIGLGVFSTALAYVLYFRVLATAGATNALLVTFLIPVSAILLGITLLDETLLYRHLAGMALVGLGLSAIDGRPWAALRRLVD